MRRQKIGAALCGGAFLIFTAPPTLGATNICPEVLTPGVSYDCAYIKPDSKLSWGEQFLRLIGVAGAKNRYALLVGISDYSSGKWLDDLPTTSGDVARVATFLLHEQGFDHVRVLTEGNVTQPAVRGVILNEFREIGADDELLVYWSGHGVDVPDAEGASTGYLPVSSTVGEDDVASMIEMGDLTRWQRRIAAEKVVYLIDACFSGLAVATKSTPLRLNPLKTREINLRQLAGKSAHILTAGESNQKAIAGERWDGSLFTWAVLQGLRGGADAHTEDFPRDGLVHLSELESYVWSAMDYEARNAGYAGGTKPDLEDIGPNNGQFYFVTSEEKARISAAGLSVEAYSFEYGDVVVKGLGSVSASGAMEDDPPGAPRFEVLAPEPEPEPETDLQSMATPQNTRPIPSAPVSSDCRTGVSVPCLAASLRPEIEQLGDNDTKNKYLMHLAEMLAYSGDIAAAQALLPEIGDDRLRLGALQVVVDLLADGGDYEQAMALVRASNHTAFRVLLTKKIALRVYERGLVGVARGWLNEARELTAGIANPEAANDLLDDVAGGLAVTGQLDAAVEVAQSAATEDAYVGILNSVIWELGMAEMFDSARSVLDMVRGSDRSAWGYIHLINAANATGHPDVAENAADEAGDLIRQSTIRAEIAAVHLAQGNRPKARDLLEQSLRELSGRTDMTQKERAWTALLIVEKVSGVELGMYPPIDRQLAEPVIDLAVEALNEAQRPDQEQTGWEDDDLSFTSLDALLANAAGYYALAGSIDKALATAAMIDPQRNSVVDYSALALGLGRAGALDRATDVPFEWDDIRATAEDRVAAGEADAVLARIEGYGQPGKLEIELDVVAGLREAGETERAVLLLHRVYEGLNEGQKVEDDTLQIFARAFASVGEYERAVELAERISEHSTRLLEFLCVGYSLAGQDPNSLDNPFYPAW